jgi:hypothetical protein
MPKRVRIEGESDTYEVLVETTCLKLLVNRAAQRRRTIETLEGQLTQASQRFAEAVDLEASAAADNDVL